MNIYKGLEIYLIKRKYNVYTNHYIYRNCKSHLCNFSVNKDFSLCNMLLTFNFIKIHNFLLNNFCHKCYHTCQPVMMCSNKLFCSDNKYSIITHHFVSEESFKKYLPSLKNYLKST